ncbi:hypothetical protein F5X99DRAFT_429488 [Biscogniauxia marginata]|nr:hypothetical protein F5X99DRAFT_429488 [Biscogniauxia marginata]
MAWPRDAPDENEKSVKEGAPLGLTHEDIHGGNFMFGPLMEGPEHSTTPILKLIDFGLSRLWPGNTHSSGATCQQFNVLDIGIMMASLILLQTHAKYTGEPIEVDLSKVGRPAATETPASGFLPDITLSPNEDPCPQINFDLRCVIAACLASDPELRPTLEELETWAFSEVCKAYPGGATWESDEMIEKIIQACIFDAEC